VSVDQDLEPVASQLDAPQAGWRHRIHERTRLTTRSRNFVDHCKELKGHDCRSEVAVGQAEGLHGGSKDGAALGGAVPDALVLHENWPAALAGVGKPLCVGYVLIGGNAVLLGERADVEAGGAQQGRDLDATEASVEEQIREPLRVPRRHLGCDAGGDPHGVLELDWGDSVFLGHGLKRFAGPEQR